MFEVVKFGCIRVLEKSDLKNGFQLDKSNCYICWIMIFAFVRLSNEVFSITYHICKYCIEELILEST